MSSPTFVPPVSTNNDTTNIEAKNANMKREKKKEEEQLVNLGPELKKTQEDNKNSSPAPVPAPGTVTSTTSGQGQSTTPSVTPSTTPAPVPAPVPAPGTDNLDKVLNQLTLKYNNNNTTLIALKSKLGNNLSSIKVLRINASDGAKKAEEEIERAKKEIESNTSADIQRLSDQLNKIDFKDLSTSIFNLKSEEENIQNAIDEINKTKNDGSVDNTKPLPGGKRKTKRRRSRKNSKKSKRRSKRH